MLLAQVISHSMTISLPLGQHTREVDTNDGDVPSDDLLPAKSQTSRAKSGDASRVVWGCHAKVGQAFRQDWPSARFFCQNKCSTPIFLLILDAVNDIMAAWPPSTHLPFCQEDCHKVFGNSLVVPESRIWTVPWLQPLSASRYDIAAKGFGSGNLLQEARFITFTNIDSCFVKLDRIWDHSKLLSSHCIEWLNSTERPNLFFNLHSNLQFWLPMICNCWQLIFECRFSKSCILPMVISSTIWYVGPVVTFWAWFGRTWGWIRELILLHSGSVWGRDVPNQNSIS